MTFADRTTDSLDAVARWYADRDEGSDRDLADVLGAGADALAVLGLVERRAGRYVLTAIGGELAAAIDDGRVRAARRRARSHLEAQPFTAQLRRVLRGSPMPEHRLAPTLAAMAAVDRCEPVIGVTLLDAYEWAGIVHRDEDGRFRLPDRDTTVADGGLVGGRCSDAPATGRRPQRPPACRAARPREHSAASGPATPVGRARRPPLAARGAPTRLLAAPDDRLSAP